MIELIKSDEIYQSIGKLEIVNITLERERDNPQQIFESLNSTGMDLDQSDLIRNYVLMGLEPKFQKRIYQMYWNPMENMFQYEKQSELMNDFFRDYIISMEGKIPTKALVLVYEGFKKIYDNLNDETVEKICLEIYEYARLYTNKPYFKDDDKNINSIFKDIKSLKMNVAYPFVLNVYKDYKEYNHWNLQRLENNSDFSDKSFGIHMFFDKIPFLKDELFPYVLHSGFGETFDYGKASVCGENSFVINKLKEYLQKVDYKNFNAIFNEIKTEENLIFISINGGAFYQFEYNNNQYSKNYISNWSNEFLNLDIKNKKNLSGVYKINDSYIPVYNIYSQDEEAMIILMNTKYMGKINQYILKDVNEDDHVKEYSISIKEISEKSEVEKHTLEDPPCWLQDRGDRVEQSKYLQEKVIIKISEKIDFKIDEEIKGSIIYVYNSK